MPVDFSLSDEQREIQALARDFALREIRPVAAEYDAREEMPWPVLEKAARVGLLSYGLPEEYGGGGRGDYTDSFAGGRSFVRSYGLTYPNLRDPEGASGARLCRFHLRPAA